MSITLAALAAARGVSAETLRRLGWQDSGGAVAIPWPTTDGPPAWHIRHRLDRAGAGPRWTWRGFERSTLLPYGTDRLAALRAPHPEALVLVESEADAVALWTAGVPALAVGGADGWQARWWPLLDGFERVVVWLEDAGSLPLLRRLLATRPAEAPPVAVAHALGQAGKDPGRLLAHLNGTGQEVLRQIVERAVAVEPVADVRQAVVGRLGARRSGQGYEARCPFHEDATPSLSLFQSDGDWRFKCHGGSCGVSGSLAFLGAALGLVAGGGDGLERAVPASQFTVPIGGVNCEAAPAAEAEGLDTEGASVPWPTLDPAVLHGLAGDVVRAIDPATEADPAAVLLTFLSAFGAALGPSAYCQVGAERHPFRIWCVLVGHTAKGRKGSSWAPVRAILERADPAFAAGCILGGLSTGEGLIWAIRDPILGRERVKQGGTTCYREVETDPGVADKRLLAVEEEFSAVLKVLAREGNTLSAVLRQAWDRGELRILTKNSPARATGAHVVVVGHAVAEEIRRYLAESEMAGGFGNRFLWACVRRSKCLPRGSVLDPGTLDALGQQVAAALAFGRTAGRVDWSDEAGSLWDGVYPELSEGKPGLAGAMTARLEAHALRLAGLYAVLDGSRLILPEHLEAALAIVDYCEASARWIFGDSLGDSVADAILQALRRQGELSRWAIYELFGRHVPSQRIVRALQMLQSLRLAEVDRQETGGRPAEVWRACRR